MWLKACPKCGGDMYRDSDIRGEYRQCLQCGYTLYEEQHPRRPVARRAKTAPNLPRTASRAKRPAEPPDAENSPGSLPQAA